MEHNCQHAHLGCNRDVHIIDIPVPINEAKTASMITVVNILPSQDAGAACSDINVSNGGERDVTGSNC